MLRVVGAVKEKTITLIEYVKTNFKTFECSPLNEVDSLVFAQISYINLDKTVATMRANKPFVKISSLFKAEEFEHQLDKLFFTESFRELIFGICSSPRFRDVKMNYHVNITDKETEEQFSAVTFELPTGEIVISFRGTDSTLVGWKEDLNMMFISPIPSQKTAVRYLQAVAKKTDGDIILTGHSKGGNLAAYSSIFAENSVRDRVIAVYNYDGPSFPRDISESQKFKNNDSKIIKIIPEGSLIGILLDADMANSDVVKSENVGFHQHDAFSWKIYKNRFLRCNKISSGIKYADENFNAYLYDLNVEQRKTLVDSIYAVITATKAESIFDFATMAVKEKDAVLTALSEIDNETKLCIRELIKRLIRVSFVRAFAKDDEIQKGISVYD